VTEANATSIAEIMGAMAAHEERRLHSVNLVASENLLSPAARSALVSDLGHRYCIPPADQRPAGMWDYPNQDAVRLIQRLAEQLACQALGAQAADVRPLSGNNAAYLLIKSLMLPGETMASVPASCGGHFATEEICRREGIVRLDIPYRWDTGSVDVEATASLCSSQTVKLLFLDASMMSHPYPLRELRASIPKDTVIAYDASHPLGIITGGHFQHPLLEGADIVQGSTHKSLFGPQKALFAFSRPGVLHQAIHQTISPLLVSNSHSHHTAALAVALCETLDFGEPYARRVIANARALAAALHESGAAIPFSERRFTDCHQFVWPVGNRKRAEQAWCRLGATGLHVNLVRVPFRVGEFGFRIGTAEVTRRGMGVTAMTELAELLTDIVRGPDRPARTYRLHDKVASLSTRFPCLSFGYDASVSPLGVPH
jgi:glycine hydroxymethyltransferase